MENTIENVAVETVAAETTGFMSKALASVQQAATSKVGIGVGITAAAGLLGYAGYRAYKSYKAKGEAKTAVERAREAAEQHAANSQS